MKAKLNNINASSLFHFTGRFDFLQKIIRKGIRFSYAFEDLSYDIVNPIAPYLDDLSKPFEQLGVAIPMISFCDIPIVRASNHIDRYGEYMIGLDKSMIIDMYNNIVNPVIYMESNNLYLAFRDIASIPNEMLKEMLKKIVQTSKEDEDSRSKLINEEMPKYITRIFNIRFMMGLTKPVYNPIDNYCFYDEREWRAFWPDNHSDEKGWKWDVTREKYDKYKKEWNKELAHCDDGYMKLFPSMITQIVVKSESQISKTIDLILNSKTIFGDTNVSVDERLTLVSKVTSLERIALDY